MGSSVWHGGFSTFVALSVLSPSKTYLFVVFYRLWFGIILFGMANGFLLLPVILSFIGPTETAIDPTLFKEEDDTKSDIKTVGESASQEESRDKLNKVENYTSIQ